MDNLSYQSFLDKHQLQDEYLEFADKWFAPLIESILTQHKKKGSTLYVGVNGCQGSGKSTLGDYLVTRCAIDHDLHVVSCSIDDFYLSRSERTDLASSVHPLLQTRGVPGTHNPAFLKETLVQLSQQNCDLKIPKFDKSVDNPLPESLWPSVNSPVDVVIIEGWCWGVQPEPEAELALPFNELERSKDIEGTWRKYVNEQLRDHYCPLYEMMDIWLMLKAPSFDCVYQWRLEQEQKLAATIEDKTGRTLMSDQELHDFIQYYQRLTEHALAMMPSKVNFLYEYDGHRQILNCRRPKPLV